MACQLRLRNMSIFNVSEGAWLRMTYLLIGSPRDNGIQHCRYRRRSWYKGNSFGSFDQVTEQGSPTLCQFRRLTATSVQSR